MRTQEWIMGIILAGLIMTPLCFILVSGGTIKIERPYLSEYNQCKQQVNDLERSIQCPDVRCNCGSNGLLWTIIGAIFGMSGYGMYFYALHKTNKLEEKAKAKTTEASLPKTNSGLKKTTQVDNK